MRQRPFKWAEKCMAFLIKDQDTYHLLGDYTELHLDISECHSPLRAHLWYMSQLIMNAVEKLSDSLIWRIIMIMNYLKIAFRQLWRQKGYTLINISGLSVGMALFILAMLYSSFFLNYNHFHKDLDQIYLVGMEEVNGHVRLLSPDALAPRIASSVEGIEGVTRYDFTGEKRIRVNDKTFFERRIRRVDPEFLSILSFPLLKGDAQEALSHPDAIILSEATAMKYYGSLDVLGKSFNIGEDDVVIVTGVSKKEPLNSSIRFDMIRPIKENQNEQWDWRTTTIFKITEGADLNKINKQILTILQSSIPETDCPKRVFSYHLKDLLFKPSGITTNFSSQPREQYFFIIVVAIALLLVVCINFMNLSTSQALNRAREVGLRKVVGAQRSQLIQQFLGESMLIAFMALPLAILLYALFRPHFVTFMYLETQLSLWAEPKPGLIVLAVTIGVGLISGGYPAIALSAYRPSAVLKNQIIGRFKKGFLRKILVTVQYIFSVMLIIITIVTVRQFGFVTKTDLGYSRENVLSVRFPVSAGDKIDPIYEALLQHSGVEYIGRSNSYPVDWGGGAQTKVYRDRMNETSAIRAQIYSIGHDFIESLDMRLLHGRSFSRDFNEKNHAVVSESFTKRMGWDDAIGQSFEFEGWKGQVVGVLDDFHFNHVFFAATPNVLIYNENVKYVFHIKTRPGQMESVDREMERLWNASIETHPYTSDKLHDYFLELFKQTVKGQELITLLSITAIFFSCLGLLGLAAFTIARKTREIAVRKVLGASVTGITSKLIYQFLLLIAIANIIAMPLGYYGGSFLLNMGWVERIPFSIDIFLIGAGISVLTALLAVTFQSIRAANANPAKTLRTE
ncbi:ABC transporter permease [bacterium]|nr:ABC transporter permease [bacterium]